MGQFEKNNNAIIGKMFVDYGNDDKLRAKSYCNEFKEIPSSLLLAAINKVTTQCRFFPTKADIYAELDSLKAEYSGIGNLLEWDEVWAEIQEKIRKIGPYDIPKWSSEEIHIVVKMVGWRNLCTMDYREMSITQAQMRDNYNSLCKRKKEEKNNKNLLQNKKQYAIIRSKDELFPKIRGAEKVVLLSNKELIGD